MPSGVRIPLPAPAAIAQLVERIHGKDEVSGSNPDRGSTFEYVPTKLKEAQSSRASFNLVSHNPSLQIHATALGMNLK